LARTPPDGAEQVLAWLRESPLASEQTHPFDLGWIHPLAPWFSERQNGAVREGRSLREWAVLDRFGDRLAETIAVGDSTEFIRGLATIATHSVQRPIRPRTRAIGTQCDRQGDRVIFPPSMLISDRLTLIHRELGSVRSPPLYRAVVAMAAVSNCHPFDDGNGRTSRMLFNVMARRGVGRNDLYVPLHEFAALSGGSLTLAVREAELYNRWEMLFQFVERCLSLLASGALRPGDRRHID
jgi:hypothetical protein